nr:hypothetical protein [Phycisphaerae bacterium]
MPIDLDKLPDKEGPKVDLSRLPDQDTPASMGDRLWNIPESAEMSAFAKKLMKDEWQNAQDIGNLYPVAEMAASITTNLYGLPISGLAGLVFGGIPSLIMDKNYISPVMKWAQDALIYQPQTEAGRRLTHRGFYPFELLQKIGDVAQDKVYEETGSKGLATAVGTVIEALPAIAGLKVFKGRISQGLQNSATWRRMTIKERGLVVQSLEETARKNPHLTEAELVRNSKKYFEEAVKRDAEAAERLRVMQEAEKPATEAATEKPVTEAPAEKPAAKLAPGAEKLEAALKFPDENPFNGDVVRAKSHYEALTAAEAKYGKIADEIWDKTEGGFVEPDGKFITQVEATKKYGEGTGVEGEVLSEDVANAAKVFDEVAENIERTTKEILREPVVDQESLERVGNVIAEKMGITETIEWEFRESKDGIVDFHGRRKGPAAGKPSKIIVWVGGERTKTQTDIKHTITHELLHMLPEYSYMPEQYPRGVKLGDLSEEEFKKILPALRRSQKHPEEFYAKLQQVWESLGIEEVVYTDTDIRIPIPKEPIKPEAIAEYEQLAGEAARRALERVEEYYKKEEVKIWKEAKREAKPFVEEDPVYAMQSEIVEAGGINRQSMIDNDVAATDIADLNRKRPRLVTKKGQLSADSVAGQMGYDTVDAMVQDWKMRPTKKAMMEEVAAQMADEMLIGLDATKDIEFQTLVAEEEVKILSKMLGKKPKVRRDFRVTVDKLTRVIPVKDAVLIQNERLALKDAIRARARVAREAFRAGKKEAALKAKEEQIAKLAKLRATMEARKSLNKTKALLKKAKKGVRKMRKGPGANIQRLLDELDPVKLSKKKRLELEEWAEFVEENPEVELSKGAWEAVKRLDKKPLADLTMAQLEGVRDYILHQFHVNRSMNKIIRKKRRQELDDIVTGSINSMVPPNKNSLFKSMPPGKYEKGRAKRRIKHIFGLGQDGYDLMVESIGGKESPIWDVLADDLFSARNSQLRIIDRPLTDYGNAAEAIYKKYRIKKPEKWLAEKIKTGRHEFTRAERVAFYRHSLNKDNITAIVEGGYGKRFSDNPFRVEGMTLEELDAILKDISNAEKALAEEPMTKFFDYFGKKMAAVFYDKNGYPLTLMDPGEYYPKQVMSTARRDAMDIEQDNAVEKFRRTGFTRIGVDRSNTIDRVGSKKAIYINPFWYDMVRFAQRNATYIAYEMPLTNASRLMNDPRFKTEMVDRYPPELYFEIQKGLRDIAGSYLSYDILEEGLLRLKNNLSIGVLGGPNFKVMGRQFFSFPLYLLYVRPRHLIGGFIETSVHPRRVHQAHLENSPKYKERVQSGFSRDLHDVFRDKNWQKILGNDHIRIKDAYMSGVRKIDKVAVSRGMQGAIRDVLAQIRRGKFNKTVE